MSKKTSPSLQNDFNWHRYFQVFQSDSDAVTLNMNNSEILLLHASNGNSFPALWSPQKKEKENKQEEAAGKVAAEESSTVAATSGQITQEKKVRAKNNKFPFHP